MRVWLDYARPGLCTQFTLLGNCTLDIAVCMHLTSVYISYVRAHTICTRAHACAHTYAHDLYHQTVLFYHFVGAAPGSTDVVRWVCKIIIHSTDVIHNIYYTYV